MESLAKTVRGVEAAKDALTAARPSGRGEGVPLAEAVAGFEEGLTAAAAAMSGWRGQDLEDRWSACEAALAESARRAEALRLAADLPEGYDRLYAVLGSLLDPLEAFEDAVEAILRSGR